ncbi:MAG: hypothetical protein KL863_02485 [Rhizobium sp.]|nr:hypothetical protein [Rhizobium sp.]
MSDPKDKGRAEAQAYQPIPFAKKHRISVEDATTISEEAWYRSQVGRQGSASRRRLMPPIRAICRCCS